MDLISFYIFGGLAVLASLGVVGQRNPMHSVMLLITSFGALAGLYILLDAPFTAVTQIIIYAGAIMVLFLFVVMLLNVPREDAAEWDRSHPLYRPMAVRIGGTLANMVTMTVFINDVRLGDRFVEMRAGFFPGGNFPASALITVSNFARPGMLIEIQGVAVIGG